MTDWKEKVGESIRSLADRQEALTAGLRRGADCGTDALEKLASFQLGLAADSVEASVAQARLLVQSGDPLALVERQIAFVSELGESVTAKTGELGEVMSECASDVAGLFAVAPKAKSTTRARKAA